MENSKWILLFLLLLLFNSSWCQKSELSVQTGHTSMIKGLSYSHDGKILASADGQNNIILWDMETGCQMAKFYFSGKNNSYSNMCFNADDNLLIVGTTDGKIFGFDLITSEIVLQTEIINPISVICPSESPDSIFVITNQLYSYNLKSKKLTKLSENYIVNLFLSKNKQYFALGNFGELYSIDNSVLKRESFCIVKPEILEERQKRYEIISARMDQKISQTTKQKKISNYQARKYYSGSFMTRSTISRAVISEAGDRMYLIQMGSRIAGYSITSKERLFVRSGMYFDDYFTSMVLCPDNNYLLAGNTDGKIYVINKESGKLEKLLKEHNSEVNSLAISPNGKFFASASTDRSIIIWNSLTLEPVKRLYSRAFPITSLDVSEDGSKLVIGDEIGFIKSINLNDALLGIKFMKPHNQEVYVISFLNNDSLVFSSGKDNRIIKSNINQMSVIQKTAFKRLFKLNLFAFNILEAIGVYIPERTYFNKFNIKTENHFEIVGGRYAFGNARKYHSIEFNISFNGNNLKKEKIEKLRKIKYAENSTCLYDSAASIESKIDFYNKLNGHADKITGFKTIKNKNLVVTSSLDATIKIWDLKSHALLLTLIPIDKNKLIKLTAENYYMAPKSALTAIGFKYGKEFYPPEQFDVRFNRPDKVLSVLGNSDPELLRAYEIAYNKRIKKLNFNDEMLSDEFHVPTVTITNVSEENGTNSSIIKVNLSVNDTKYNLNRINIFNNDIPVFGTSGIELKDKNTGQFNSTVEIPLIPGKNKIQVSGLNEKGAESLKKTIEIIRAESNEKPNLYIVSIGVSKYTDKRFDLNYAAKDAKDVAKLFSESKMNYGSVICKTLTDSEVTKDNIEKLKDFLKQSKPNDVVIVFIAGHGMLDEQFNYYFGTSDIDFNNPSLKGIEYAEIENLLDGIPAMKKILFMDTCHSGEADKEDLELTSQTVVETGNVKFRNAGAGVRNKKAFGMYNTSEMMKDVFADIRKGTGSTIVSSAGAAEFAFEGKDWSNGLFTYCLIKGIKDNAADLNRDKKIVISELQDYIRMKVTELSNGMQVPNARLENLSMDFRVW
ncbi:MAG: caspase family protein [Bacteroidia bacterium]|nr:caspase family protein [Bacteroidia bacterium]